MHLSKTVGHTVLVRELSPERRSAGGIVIPETAQDEYARYGVVQAVGPRVDDDEIAPGATVVYSRFHNRTRVDGIELQVVSEGDIYAIVDETPLDPPIPASVVKAAVLACATVEYPGKDILEMLKIGE